MLIVYYNRDVFNNWEVDMIFEIEYSHPDYDENDELTEAFIDCLEAHLDYFNAKVTKYSNSKMPAGVVVTECK